MRKKTTYIYIIMSKFTVFFVKHAV